MLYVSILTSERERDPELWATVWQRAGPPALRLLGAYNLAGNRRVFVWEGESADDLQFMDIFNQVGVMETFPAFDRTQGWRYAFAGDLEGFAGAPLDQLTGARRRAVELRRRGLQAPNPYAARRAARQWVKEQEDPDQREQGRES